MGHSIKRSHNMKILYILAIALVCISVSDACINPCNGITAATCTSPCYTCGLCSEHCCQNIIGRNSLERLIIPCLSGRQDDQGEINTESVDAGIVMLEKTAFEVCDSDLDGALSWTEVEECEVKWIHHYDKFGHLVALKHLPTKEDFDHFDADQDGLLFYSEWEESVKN